MEIIVHRIDGSSTDRDVAFCAHAILQRDPFFDERLALLSAGAGRGRAFAPVLGDVDHLKKVNDSYGHGVGDEVLIHIARISKGSVR